MKRKDSIIFNIQADYIFIFDFKEKIKSIINSIKSLSDSQLIDDEYKISIDVEYENRRLKRYENYCLFKNIEIGNVKDTNIIYKIAQLVSSKFTEYNVRITEIDYYDSIGTEMRMDDIVIMRDFDTLKATKYYYEKQLAMKRSQNLKEEAIDKSIQ